MTNVIIIGHGGYGSAVRRNLDMLIGAPDGYFYVDFDEQDDLAILDRKIAKALAEVGDNDVLFACDLSGGSPFRQAAVLCTEHKNYAVVAGLNTSAYTEMSFNLEDLSPLELAKLGAEVAKETIMYFPE